MSASARDREKEIAVIGLGRFGSSLARRLEALGHHVIGIDNDPRMVKEIADEISEAVILDAMDEDALREIDVSAFHTVVVAINRNFEANALITSTLKKLGIPHVISQSNTDRHREILLRIGADQVILPDEESGYRLADRLSIPGMRERLQLSPDYSLIEILLPRILIGQRIDACEPYKVIVILVLRGDELIVNPDPNSLFFADDLLVIVGEKRNLAEFSSLE